MTTPPPLDLSAILNPRIEGERIYLRRLDLDDVNDSYLQWMNDPEVNRFLESRFVTHSQDSLMAFVNAMKDDPLTLFLGIFLRHADQHVGNIKLGPINTHHSRAEIGLLIGERECWGKGYATEAISVVTAFAFKHVGLHKIVAGAYSNNIGSTNAFIKSGYTVEGQLASHWYVDGHYSDGVLMAQINPRHG